MRRLGCWVLFGFLAMSQWVHADDLRTEEFREKGALQRQGDAKFTGKVSISPCKCVKYDYDEGSQVDRKTGYELPGLCTKNAHYTVCHHNNGRYAGQSEACPLSCVVMKEVPLLTVAEEKKMRSKAVAAERSLYNSAVPAPILASLARKHSDWEPLVVRRIVEDYDRQMEFDPPKAVYFQGPMQKGGKTILGGVVFFSIPRHEETVPWWAFFEAKTAELLFSGPAPFLFDTKGTNVSVSLFPAGQATGAPTTSFIFGTRMQISDSKPCCGPYLLDDLGKGPRLLSDDEAGKLLTAYSSSVKVDDVALLNSEEAFYGTRLNPIRKAIALGPSGTAVYQMPSETSSVLTNLPAGGEVQVKSRGGEGSEWLGIVTRDHLRGYVRFKSLQFK